MSQQENATVATANLANTSTHRKFGARDKLGYMLGDLGNDLFFTLASLFLMVYYTDVLHISAAAVGVLFLVARLWDAIADIAWGRFIDIKKPTKTGKFRPWILRMSFPLVLCGVLMFVKIPGMSNNFYLVYAFVTYILWGTLYSTVNIPYGSMASVITDDPIERTALSTFRTMGSMLAGIVISIFGPLVLFVNNVADANRFLFVALVFGVLSMASFLACYKMSTERLVIDTGQSADKKSLKVTIKGLGKNKPLISILFISLIFMMLNMLTSAVNVYIFKNYFNDASALSLAGLFGLVSIFIAFPLTKPLVKRFGKKELAATGMLIAGTANLAIFLWPNISVMTFIIMSAIIAFGIAFFNVVIWAFVTDVIDYHEYLTGLREDGTVYSIYSFARKVGQALAGGLGGFAIQAVGYQSSLEVQTEQTLDGIFALGTLVPGIVFIMIFLLLVFTYPMNKQRTIQLAVDLANKRKEKH